jgi:hypothetical protein
MQVFQSFTSHIWSRFVYPGNQQAQAVSLDALKLLPSLWQVGCGPITVRELLFTENQGHIQVSCQSFCNGVNALQVPQEVSKFNWFLFLTITRAPLFVLRLTN